MRLLVDRLMRAGVVRKVLGGGVRVAVGGMLFMVGCVLCFVGRVCG